MSFTLRIRNAPSGSAYWWADYARGGCYSGWLGTGETWGCPYGAYGATDLHIWVVDAGYNTVHSKYGLGPIHDDRDYTYDCAAGQLSEGAPGPGPRADIVSIDAPSEATTGEMVAITATLRNSGGEEGWIAVIGHYNSVEMEWVGDPWEWLAPGRQAAFTLRFIMPAAGVSCRVDAETWGGDDWVTDDYRTFSVSLSEPSPPPVADFTAAPAAGDTPLTVYFTDRSTGEITGWSWNFGDGHTSYERHPIHTYYYGGAYRVILTVTGPGGTGWTDFSVTVSEEISYAFDIGYPAVVPAG